jgi:hypothetical protein
MIFPIFRPKLEEKFPTTLKFQIPPGENNIARPAIKAFVLTDQNHTLEEVCYWIDSFNHFVSRLGISNNPQELFFNFELLLSSKALKDFESTKAKVLGNDNPTVVSFRNVLTEWKHRRGSRPFQAERVPHDEMKNIRKPNNMSVNASGGAARIEEINSYPSQLLPPSNHQIPQDKIITIIKHCNSNYFNKLVEKDVQTQEHPDLRRIVEYYNTNLEDLEQSNNKSHHSNKSRSRKNGQDPSSKLESSNAPPSHSNKPNFQCKPAEARISTDTDDTYCKYHKTHNHGWAHCRKNPAVQNSNSSGSRSRGNEESHQMEEIHETPEENSGIIRDKEEDSNKEFYNMDVVEGEEEEKEADPVSPFDSQSSVISQTHRNIQRIVESGGIAPDKAKDFVPEVLSLVYKSIASGEKKTVSYFGRLRYFYEYHR